jgi:NTP pyrophosphatase (non-canonical NTP hydrolase)
MPNESLTLDQYQQQATATDRTRTAERGLHLAALGLVGEVGSLLSEVKKKQRDSRSYIGYEGTVTEEMGDALWYLAIIASHAHVTLSALAPSQPMSGGSTKDFSFREIQPQARLALDAPTVQFERTLLSLAEAVGRVAGMSVADVRAETDQVRTLMTGVFTLLVRAADEAGISLEDAATRNLAKIVDRWPTERVPAPFFDDDFPPEEQLPRSLTVEIFERQAKNGKHYVVQRCNGVFVGDRLTDNIMKPDDYRFHDAFHYAYAAVLGWSPVTRALFRLKRKSETKIDEGQDGARAILIEEGVATYIFGEAKQLDFFEGRGAGDLSFTLLKSVRQFVRGYESDVCPLWQWEEAILQGNEAFRFLRQHRRARLQLDLQARSLRVEELPS